MQNRLSQGLRALKYLKALMSTEPCSGADRMPCVAGSGVCLPPRHSRMKPLRRDVPNRTNERRNLSFSLLVYFVVPETKPRASQVPGKHPIGSYISSLTLC